MHTLKDVIKTDLDMFFNTSEMAEDATINEMPCIVIMKSNALKELKLKIGESLSRAELMFRVRKSELPGKPKVHKTMKFNGLRYEILSCSEESFTYDVILGANQ